MKGSIHLTVCAAKRCCHLTRSSLSVSLWSNKCNKRLVVQDAHELSEHAANNKESDEKPQASKKAKGKCGTPACACACIASNPSMASLLSDICDIEVHCGANSKLDCVQLHKQTIA